MANENNMKKKGFSGISNLASEVGAIEDHINPDEVHDVKSDEKSSVPKPLPQSQRETASSKTAHNSSSSSPIDPVSLNNREGGSSGKWIIGIISVLCVIWLINSGENSNRDSSYNPSTSSRGYSDSKTSSTSVAQSTNAYQSAQSKFSKPPAGTENILSIPEICWCLREEIRIEAIQNVIVTKEGLDEFNRLVNDYNIRCASYRYRQNDQSDAERIIAQYKNMIASEAVQNAKKFDSDNKYQSSNVFSGNSQNSNPPGNSQKDASSAKMQHTNANFQEVSDIQRILKALGYNPGPIDGTPGRKTVESIMAFQREVGYYPDGAVNELTLILLQRALSNRHYSKAKNKPSKARTKISIDCGEGFTITPEGGCKPTGL